MINVLGVGQRRRAARATRSSSSPGRDDLPPGPGANDNGSGTGALVELARTLVGSVTQTSLVFASVDGTTAESAGARELARHPPGGLKLRAGIALRAIGRADGRLVLRLSGEGHRLPAAGWLRTVEQALRDEDVDDVRLPSLGQQVAGARRTGRARRSGARSSAAAPPWSASTARGPARAPRPTRRTCSRPTCSGASARRPSSPRSRSTRARAPPAWARPTSSPATACCAAGRSSSSSWPC